VNADVAFQVHGTPAPQGSKTRTRYGHVREDNPNTGPWRNAVAAAAHDAMRGRPPLAGPLRLEVTFVLPRPKGHYRTGRYAGELRDRAPRYCPTRPDLDKLLRAVGDAITGIVVVDDAQLVRVNARKMYGSPGVYIAVGGAE
jgi:crossover junction endodeoxyribonuclease RusA